MTQTPAGRSTRDSRLIKAPPSAVYRAFLDPALLARWQAPKGMTARIHSFDGRVGGGYRMSLTYDGRDPDQHGKSEGRIDTFESRFVELLPDSKIVQKVRFETDKPEYAGEMTMIADLAASAGGTDLTLTFENLPAGIRLEDNAEGTRSSLANLAALLE